jgi:hypothetical protein
VFEGRAEPAWRAVLRERQAGFVVVHLYDPVRQATMLHRLYGNLDEWVPCYVKGKTAIFAWRDPGRRTVAGKPPPLPDPRLEHDFAVEAFGKGAEPLPDAPPPDAKRPWWRPLVEPPAPAGASYWHALHHYTRFEAMGLSYSARNQSELVAGVGLTVVGLAGQSRGPMLLSTTFLARLAQCYGPHAAGRREPDLFDRLAMYLFSTSMRQQDAGPPDALYLAIREARRGLAEGRDEARTALILAQAYNRLHHRTRERSRTARLVMADKGAQRYQSFFPQVDLIRRAQVAAALNRVFKLDPPARVRQAAHLHLLDVYQEPQYLELAVKHFREYVQLCKAMKYVPGVPPERTLEEIDAQATRLKEAERQLKDAQDRYELRSAGKTSVLEKALIALDSNLPDTALKLLTEADPKDVQAPNSRGVSVGAALTVGLLLAVGRVDDASQPLVEAAKDPSFDRRLFGTNQELGLPAYEWFRVILGAATGDYQSADQFLEECLKHVEVLQSASGPLGVMEVVLSPLKGEEKRKLTLSDFAALTVGDILLGQAPAAAGVPWQWGRFAPLRPRNPKAELPIRAWQLSLGYGTGILNQLQSRQADLWTLRAWLALEQGSTERAREQARKALALGGRRGANSVFLADLIVELTEKQGKQR